jgi:hypothetical protein
MMGCRTDGILFEIAYQPAHAEATDLLVITQRVMQRCVEPIRVQRRDKFWRLSENDSDKAFHVRGAARIQLAVPLGGDERVGIPVLAVYRDHIRVPRENEARLVRVAEGREQIGFFARRVVGQPRFGAEPLQVVANPFDQT